MAKKRFITAILAAMLIMLFAFGIAGCESTKKLADDVSLKNIDKIVFREGAWLYGTPEGIPEEPLYEHELTEAEQKEFLDMLGGVKYEKREALAHTQNNSWAYFIYYTDGTYLEVGELYIKKSSNSVKGPRNGQYELSGEKFRHFDDLMK